MKMGSVAPAVVLTHLAGWKVHKAAAGGEGRAAACLSGFQAYLLQDGGGPFAQAAVGRVRDAGPELHLHPGGELGGAEGGREKHLVSLEL